MDNSVTTNLNKGIKMNNSLTLKSNKRIKSEASESESLRLERIAQEAEQKFGDLIVESINPNAMAMAFFLSKALPPIVYVGTEDRMYRRNQESGLYENLHEDLLCNEILQFLINFFLTNRDLIVPHKFTPELARKIMTLVKGFCRDDQFFAKKASGHILHMQNCFIEISDDGEVCKQYPLDTEWIHSRNQIYASYAPEAKADRFMNELLKPVLDPDEIEVFLKYAAQCLLHENIAEKILLITGLAGSGKSVSVNILEGIIGKQNITQLRTDCLHGWYETNRYIGKSLLVGKDVSADFLRKRGISQLKALTGKDRISTEAKHSNAIGEIEGTYNVIITSNSSQPILLQNDRDAWARRILTIEFKGAPPKNPIPKFDEVLLAEERSGIFNELLKRLKSNLADGGHIVATEAQKRAINDLLDESESPLVFLRNCVEAVEPPRGESFRKCKENLTSEELYLAYMNYCDLRHWEPVPTRKFQEKMVDLMPRLFQRFRRNDIVRNGTNHRGYYAVRFINN